MKQYDIQYLPIKSSKYIKNLITIQKNNLHFPVFLEYSNPITDDVSHFTFSVRNCIIKYEDIKGKISFDELYNRYNKKEYLLMDNQDFCESIVEESESYSDDSLYNITSFGIDMSFREIVTMYKEGDLEKPELQRKYVWTKNEASRFIDSILLGLPVPSIFLAKTNDNKRLIVDGYQRIMTVYDYMEGVFSGDSKKFRLSNSDNIHPNWRGKTFEELTDEQKRTIKTYPIHAIVFEQKHPQDDTGMYQIFERINTSGRALRPQEIRNCVYHGEFNNLLFSLNKENIWRQILNLQKEDSRMSDVELILRFFAFSEIEDYSEFHQTQINLVKFLNIYMGSKKNMSKDELERYQKLFLDTMDFLYANIGKNLFRTCKVKNNCIVWAKKVNPVILDAVCTATIKVKNKYPDEQFDAFDLKKKYENLLKNEKFLNVIKQRTTNVDNIKSRVAIAAKELYGKEL